MAVMLKLPVYVNSRFALNVHIMGIWYQRYQIILEGEKRLSRYSGSLTCMAKPVGPAEDRISDKPQSLSRIWGQVFGKRAERK